MIRVTQTRVFASEWTKLLSLRSSRASLVVAVTLMVGLGLVVPWLSVLHWKPGTSTAHYNSVDRSLSGIYLAQLAFGVLGAMVVTSEYATGSIRATFAAVPRRLPVLWGKVGVFAAVALVLGTIASVLAFFGGQAIFAAKNVDASFGDPHVARTVLGAGLFLAAIGAFGLALGALLRNTAAAITTLTLLLFVVPTIVGVLPSGDAVEPYLPGAAGQAVASLDPGALGPWTGFALLCGYVVLTLGTAAVLLVRRDV
jgi:ABC-type transport system involved in multi-copper enzyme maturation permease subunit